MTIYRGLNGVESGTPVDTALEDSVTFENLDANGDVGTDAGQVAIGDHLHTGVYEPADATILKDADIGVTVQARSSVLDNTTASFLAADETKLDGIETAATVDQTGAEIKVAYEAESDTNAFTDAEKTSVGTISGLAPLASPTFTGVPLSPTPATSDDSTKIATTAFINALLASREYVSPEITIVAAGATTLTHGLGAKPTKFSVQAICKVADGGYGVGDVVEIAYLGDGGGPYGVAVYQDNDTEVKLKIANRAQPLFVVDNSTGGYLTLTTASWRLIVRASL